MKVNISETSIDDMIYLLFVGVRPWVNGRKWLKFPCLTQIVMKFYLPFYTLCNSLFLFFIINRGLLNVNASNIAFNFPLANLMSYTSFG